MEPIVDTVNVDKIKRLSENPTPMTLLNGHSNKATIKNIMNIDHDNS